MNKRSISMKEIAEISGVSIATVSRVINNNGRFSEETKQRVLRVIQKYDYQTNSLAKGLREKRSGMIGMIVPDISNDFFALMINNIEKNFFQKGISTIICNTDRDMDKEEAYLRSLDSKIIDGLIYISGEESESDVELSRNIPTIFIDRRPKKSKNAIVIESDNYGGGYLATEHLIDQGCNEILIVTKENNISSVNDRVKGYKEALKDNGLKVKKEHIAASPVSKKDNFTRGKEAIEMKLEEKISFDSIFSTNDWMAFGAIRALEENGIQVGKDVKVIGFDNDKIAKYSMPSMSTIAQDTSKIADIAYQKLHDLINNPIPISRQEQIKVPITLIKRDTT